MWQRFTERARKVVFFAQEEAQRFGEGYVSTEHLLLGLVKDGESTACRILQRFGIRQALVEKEINKQLPRAEARVSYDMTLTPRGKRVIDLAYDEARNLNNNYIGTEHLLLGLIREGDGMAGRTLEKLGLNMERTRREVIMLQGADPGGSKPERTPTAKNAGTMPPLRWSDGASSIYLVNRRNTRTGVVLLACLRDSEALKAALTTCGFNPTHVSLMVESELFRRLEDHRPLEPLLDEVFRVAGTLADSDSHWKDSGFVFLAGVQLDEELSKALNWTKDDLEKVAASLREFVKILESKDPK